MTNPFSIIKHRYSTEKTMVLEGLKGSQSNRCITKYSLPKHVFIVDKNANKAEIRHAIEEIYAEKKVQVLKVNTITMKPKKRRVRGKIGFKSGYKKAIVTLKEGDTIEERA